MLYSFYFILLIGLTGFAATSTTDSEHLVKLRDFVKPYFTCPVSTWPFRFYTCPSHFWPEIVHKFIPEIQKLSAWMKQKLGGDLWAYMAYMLESPIANYRVEELVRVEEETKAWLLLNRYLKFGKKNSPPTFMCLATTLNSLTDVDLGQVSRLSYGGDGDRFDEINEFVDDPKKARLLDGLKRASRDHFEMSRMLRSLNRLLKRKTYWDALKGNILYAALDDNLKNISMEQLRSETVTAPDFEKNAELRDLVQLLFGEKFHGQPKLGILPKESMPSFPGKDYLIDFVTRIREETQDNAMCRQSISNAMILFHEHRKWGDIQLPFNKCVMKGLSQLPDSFFAEYQALSELEQRKLQGMLKEASLPQLGEE